MIRRFAQHRVAANLAMIMMLLGGVWTLRGIPTQLDPPMQLPYVFVDVEWRGAWHVQSSADGRENWKLTRWINSLANRGRIRIGIKFVPFWRTPCTICVRRTASQC